MVCPGGIPGLPAARPRMPQTFANLEVAPVDEGYDGSILKPKWMNMLTSIEGRSVIVTGASKGIGKGIARVFPSKGARVLIASRDLFQAEAAAAEIRAGGGIADAISADVSKAEDNVRMAQTAIERHGGIDILYSEAGMSHPRPLGYRCGRLGPGDGYQPQGDFSLCPGVPAGAEGLGKGRIVVTSSITGPITGNAGWSHYAASKAGSSASYDRGH